MARYVYDKKKVNRALDELYSACDAIENTNSKIDKGINTILSATGAEYLAVDFATIKNYQTQAIEYIESMCTDIKKKQEEIEDWENASWFAKAGATIGMAAGKLVEGVVTIVEQIIDGVATIGFLYPPFRASIKEFIQKDYVGDFFANQYENGILQNVNKYSAMSHQSTAANVLKGFGTAAGYIAIGIVTGGTGTAALAATAAVAGVGGLGSGTQAGLQQGMTIGQAVTKGAIEGAISAGTTLIAAGVANKLGAFGKAATATDDVGTAVAKSTSGFVSAGVKTTVPKTSQGILKTAGKVLTNNKLVNGVVKLAATHPKTTIAALTAINTKKQVNNVNISNEYRKANTPAENTNVNNNQQNTQENISVGSAEETFKNKIPQDDSEKNNTKQSTALQNNTIYKRENNSSQNSNKPEEFNANQSDSSKKDSSATDTNQQSNKQETNLQNNNTMPPSESYTPSTNLSSKDDIVGNISLGNNSSYKNTIEGNTGIGSLVAESNLEEIANEDISEESILNAAGDISGSLSNIAGGSPISVPTSSTPITSTNTGGESGSRVIPLAAGLGTASIAGIGTKAYLDKKENKEDNESSIDTEEWEEELDSLNIEYEKNDEPDYLSPTDEYAYQEEPQESYQAVNSSELASMQ